MNPTASGNSGDEAAQNDEEDEEDEPDKEVTRATRDTEGVEEEVSDDELPARVTSLVPTKRGATELTTPAPSRKNAASVTKKPRTTPNVATNTATTPVAETTTTTPASNKTKKKTKPNDFNDVIIAEEATQKSAHELARSKVERDKAKSQGKIELAREAIAYKQKKEQRKTLLVELELEKLKIRRMRMEREHARAGPSTVSQASGSRSQTHTPGPQHQPLFKDDGFDYGAFEDFMAQGENNTQGFDGYQYGHQRGIGAAVAGFGEVGGSMGASDGTDNGAA